MRNSYNHSAIMDLGERMDEEQEKAIEKAEESAKMKARAETVTVPSKVQGTSGEEWRNRVLADPMRTLPGGAAFLIIAHYEKLLASEGAKNVRQK